MLNDIVNTASVLTYAYVEDNVNGVVCTLSRPGGDTLPVGLSRVHDIEDAISPVALTIDSVCFYSKSPDTVTVFIDGVSKAIVELVIYNLGVAYPSINFESE